MTRADRISYLFLAFAAWYLACHILAAMLLGRLP
jgi:hypothetical protein